MSEPWVRFEDEHLLVVAKPSGVNTHRADLHAQDGMVEWVQSQRPGASLSVLHRLDKGTSGLLVFGKTREANQALASQFEDRRIGKSYALLAARDDARPAALRCEHPLAGQPASTDFALASAGPVLQRWDAHPHTGRTHQVRAHAAALGLPVLGDADHGGERAPRLFLHAAALGLDHPVTGPLQLDDPSPPSFDRALAAARAEELAEPSLAALVAHEARAALFDPADTDAYLWIDRHHDGFPGTRVERLGDVALVLRHEADVAHADADADAGGRAGPLPDAWLDAWSDTLELRAIYEQRRARGGGGGPARLVRGAAQPRFEVTELGCRYLIDLDASATSSGLFLDQRETRRTLLTADLAGRTVLNTFAHTGSLSVAAAKAGAETLTLDLSRHYLDWAAENLRANDLDPADHDAVYGDALEWMERFAKKGRTFDLVLVDPPSSSTPRRGGRRWVVDRDLHGLVERAARVTAPGGSPVRLHQPADHEVAPLPRPARPRGLGAAGREGAVETRTIPLDHRSGPGDPPYLKAAWVQMDP